ncbi:rod-binding protein [Buchnera aphidicola]|uniref:rod-binding protein n=1 Tax=Buchnera aphidicola TaxID=9 RepID=UPI003BEEEDC5
MNNTLLPFHEFNYSTQLQNELKYKSYLKKNNALQIAKEVEGIFIQILIKNMRNTLSKDNLLDNNQSRLYVDIYDQQIAQEMTKKGIGLTNIILNNINKNKVK